MCLQEVILNTGGDKGRKAPEGNESFLVGLKSTVVLGRNVLSQASWSWLGRLLNLIQNLFTVSFYPYSFFLPLIIILFLLRMSDQARNSWLSHPTEKVKFSLLGISRSHHWVNRELLPLKHSHGLPFTEISLFLGHQASGWIFSPLKLLICFLAFFSSLFFFSWLPFKAFELSLLLLIGKVFISLKAFVFSSSLSPLLGYQLEGKSLLLKSYFPASWSLFIKYLLSTYRLHKLGPRHKTRFLPDNSVGVTGMKINICRVIIRNV